MAQTKKTEGNTYREESAEELCDAGEGGSVAFILRKTAAQEPQPALPHLVGHRAGCGKELGAPAALQVSNTKWLHGWGLRTGVAQWIEHKHHAHRREEENDPAVAMWKKDVGSKHLFNKF